ncbi:hypothetical protein D3C84_463610 [compost metagenome]
MHHEGFVEQRRLDRHLARADVDHRGLRQGGEQLVGGVGHGHRGIVGMPLAAVHAVAPLVQRVEARVGVPGLVVVDAVDALAQLAGGGLHVVAEAVVGRVGQHRQHRTGLLVARQRAVGEFLRDRLGGQFAVRHRADQATRVAPRAQVQRHRAGLVQRVVQRLVAVAVDQHGIAVGHRRVQDHLVAGRTATDRKERVVGAKYPGRIALRLGYRAGVVVQRTQLADRHAEVGAQHLLAVEIEEAAPHRGLHERRAAGVAGGVPGVFVGAGEVHQGAEEWRQDAVHVATGRRFDAPGNELGAVFGLPDEAVDILDKGQWHLALMGPAHAEHDRQVGGTPADLLDQLHGLVRVVFAQAPTDDHATVSRVGTDRDFGLVQRADQLHFDFVIP